jgi:hypothetical protein
VTLAAVTQHNRFDQRGSSEIVGVIKRRLGGNEHAHDFVVTEMGRGD